MAALISNQSGSPVKTFKLIVLGDGGTGKTAFMTRHRTGEFQKSYHATGKVEETKLKFYTNQGLYEFQIFECGGQYKYGENRKDVYQNADGCLIFFDKTSRITYKSLPEWFKEFREVSQSPVVICGNKCDCKEIKVKPEEIQFHKKTQCQYYDISAKSNYNFDKPFLYLLRKLTGNEVLQMMEAPALLPPEVQVTDEQVALWQRSLTE
jgi:GTP-binding nuclear protein Ran